MTQEYFGYLAHHGVKGQKWGVRNWQEDDGTYTEAGKHHYGLNGGINPTKKPPNGAIVERSHSQGPPKGVISARKQTAQHKPTKAEIEARKNRAKAILGIAAGVALAAAVSYGVYKHNNANQNLIQIAKNTVHAGYNDSAKRFNLTGEALRKNREWQQKDVAAIVDRHSARKVLGLNSGRKTRQFIKNNKLGKVKTADLIEQRMGPLVEGYRKTKFGNLKKLSGHHLQKARNRVARRFYV